MAVAVVIAHRDARAGLQNPGEGRRIPVEIPVAVVDVESVLQRIVLSPELVAAAHDVQIGMAVAVGIEEGRGDVLG